MVSNCCFLSFSNLSEVKNWVNHTPQVILLTLITGLWDPFLYLFISFYSHFSPFHPQIGKHSCVFGKGPFKITPTYYECVCYYTVCYVPHLGYWGEKRKKEKLGRCFSASFNKHLWRWKEISKCCRSSTKCNWSSPSFSWWLNIMWISLVDMNIVFQEFK